ncbi:bublin coiled-coil protein [Danio rerio]|uniref:Expressed sequence BC139872 n=1 Tax=Danio rerio TaxID=7955 RepID=F1QHR5_DANRE|nr:UPF0184 protein C9orf16 homolog [Danio rerio]|eukprot:NP_001289952.1 UPF0184 protein C9orf16 homolog [Danio rerio]
MSGPNGDPDISAEGIIEDEDEFNEEEYAAIDSMLDQINSCLDDIEERNDALNGKLQELLESNRAARRDFRQQITDHADLPPPANDDEDEQSRDAQKKD